MPDFDDSESFTYVTRGGVEVTRVAVEIDPEAEVEHLVGRLDDHRGVLFTSNYEVPGRYNRWSRGFVDPPVVLEAHGRQFEMSALNDRGVVILAMIRPVLDRLGDLESFDADPRRLTGTVRERGEGFVEEQRSRQPSVFSVIRAVQELFGSEEDAHLGLDGAFGYDLVFQFEDIEPVLARNPGDRDLVLYLPDKITIVDHASRSATRYAYDFATAGLSTSGIEGVNETEAYRPAGAVDRTRDHEPGEYAAAVGEAKEAFRRGDLFEVVLGQSFFREAARPPSEIFTQIRKSNPAPFGGLLNLGRGEYLISGSPEMYVRVTGSRIETCPISGTVARGDDALADSHAMLELLNSEKATSELTMCTDVDRNDKSRICVPGSVRVIGRRQVEFYSKLIHTVDHIEGRLLPQFDAIDGFLSHMWAVTVTGAPKLWAMRFIETHERSPRRWYGGAIGYVGFNGDLNTGLTIRTVEVRDGVAEVRAGSTLLFDSVPDEEERETEVKASAFLAAIMAAGASRHDAARDHLPAATVPSPKRVLLLDHEDSFVHTLAAYLRRAGADVVTVRAPMSKERFDDLVERIDPDLVFLSPGPGRPEDFKVAESIDAAVDHDLPVFGVCLGLQGIVERFGGKLGVLEHPTHGKPSLVSVTGGSLFAGLPEHFQAGRYHSLYAVDDAVPESIEVTALSEDGVVMAVEHRDLPIAAVQFHPESIMSAENDVGLRLIQNVLDRLPARNRRSEDATAG